jgi:hypothetical protein
MNRFYLILLTLFTFSGYAQKKGIENSIFSFELGAEIPMILFFQKGLNSTYDSSGSDVKQESIVKPFGQLFIKLNNRTSLGIIANQRTINTTVLGKAKIQNSNEAPLFTDTQGKKLMSTGHRYNIQDNFFSFGLAIQRNFSKSLAPLSHSYWTVFGRYSQISGENIRINSEKSSLINDLYTSELFIDDIDELREFDTSMKIASVGIKIGRNLMLSNNYPIYLGMTLGTEVNVAWDNNKYTSSFKDPDENHLPARENIVFRNNFSARYLLNYSFKIGYIL